MDAGRQGKAGEGIFQGEKKVEGGNDVYRHMERYKKSQNFRVLDEISREDCPFVLELDESCLSACLSGLFICCRK